MAKKRKRAKQQRGPVVVLATGVSRGLAEQFQALATRQGLTRAGALRRIVRGAVGGIVEIEREPVHEPGEACR
ncbi:MAG TPA: hypothetical protein VLB49_17485 [Gemmatimonadales bacterium]|nr:hypothetical protein [Gemmatimonadales bacterium]